MPALAEPAINRVQMANAMGVGAARTTTLEGLADLLRQSLCQSGPFLIEPAI